MFTLFSIPKPFSNSRINYIQRNAIQSWLSVISHEKIILFGDEEGISKVASQFGVQHVPENRKNSRGTPILSDTFQKAYQMSDTNYLCFVNCDILFTAEIRKIFSNIISQFNRFLVVGRRVDLDVDGFIDFDRPWEEQLKKKASTQGKLHNHSGIDFFFYTKPLFKSIPDFSVGRVGWDNWMIYQAVQTGIPVIDITKECKVIHQNHDYSHLNGGPIERDDGKEAKANYELAGHQKNFYTIRDSTHVFTSTGIRRRIDIYQIYRRISNKSGDNQFFMILYQFFRLISKILDRIH